MTEGFYKCAATSEKITEHESYDKVCKEWEYWIPYREPNKKTIKSCRSCKHSKWKHK